MSVLTISKRSQNISRGTQEGTGCPQWVGISHEKLLQESFVEQLNSLQTLEQLVPLKAAEEHLP